MTIARSIARPIASPIASRTPIIGGGGGGGPTLGQLVASLGGAAFILDTATATRTVYQDRSVTPSTPANVGDPVGTIVGVDGTWFAVASSDLARMTLRQTSDGRLYLEGTQNANRYMVQDAAANPLTPDGVLHTSFFAAWGFPATNVFNPFAWGSATFENAYRGNVIGTTFTPGVTNTANALIRLGDFLPHNQNSVFTLRHQNNPTLRVDGANEWLNKGTGNVRTDTVGQFTIGSRDNDAQSNGAARHYCYVLIPSILTDEQCSTIESLLYPYVRQPETPLSTAEVNVDFANSEFSWGGVSRVLADLTDNANGSYTLNYSDWGAPGYLISIDFVVPDWSLNTAGTRLLRVERDNTVEVLNREAFFYTAPSQNITYKISDILTGQASGIAGFGIGTGTSDVQRGLQRATLWVRPDEVSRFQLNGHIWQSAPFRALWKKNPDGLTVWQNFGSGNVLRMRAKGGVFNQAEADEFHSVSNVGLPVHILGDSFVVFGEGSGLALQRVIENDGYVNITFDGVGGATMAQHQTRMGNYPATRTDNVYTSTLVINDGGWSPSETTTAASINAMVALLQGHSRWCYIQPWPSDSQPIGSTSRTDSDAAQATLASTYGANYIPSVTAALAAHNDTAEDLADVANGLIPESLSADGVHPKSPAGYTVLARVIRGALARLGYWDIATAVPSAPTSLAESSLAVSWGMPTDDGNDPVRSWRLYVEDSPGSNTFTQQYTGQLRRHTLTGLTAGSWKVRVTAVNEVGEGTHAEITVTV